MRGASARWGFGGASDGGDARADGGALAGRGARANANAIGQLAASASDDAARAKALP